MRLTMSCAMPETLCGKKYGEILGCHNFGVSPTTLRNQVAMFLELSLNLAHTSSHLLCNDEPLEMGCVFRELPSHFHQL